MKLRNAEGVHGEIQDEWALSFQTRDEVGPRSRGRLQHEEACTISTRYLW